MGGNTGNLRTLRISATGGTRTLYSMLSDASSAGGGSFQRQYKYVKRKNQELYDRMNDPNTPKAERDWIRFQLFIEEYFMLLAGAERRNYRKK